MKVQSYSDIITNSSSELFVFEDGKSVDEVIDTLNEIYPDWRKEYTEPDTLKNADFDDIDIFLSYETYWLGKAELENYCKRNNIKPTRFGDFVSYDHVDVTKDDFDKELSVAKKYAEELGSTPDKVFKNWDVYNPFASYKDKDELDLDTYPEMSIYGIGLYQEKFGYYVTLRSIGENPDWDYQEKLMEVAHRYHLG